MELHKKAMMIRAASHQIATFETLTINSEMIFKTILKQIKMNLIPVRI